MRARVAIVLLCAVVIAASVAAVTGGGSADAAYLTKCEASSTATAGSVRCFGVKRAPGKDRLKVRAVVQCADVTGEVVKVVEGKAVGALELSTGHCPKKTRPVQVDWVLV